MIQPRKTVQRLQSYSPPLEGRRTHSRLDFNENTLGFPEVYDSQPTSLYTAYPEYDAFLQQLSSAWGIPKERLLLTNGSDEALFLAAFTFIEPGQDAALTVTPTFSLISHYLKLVGSRLIEVAYRDDFQYDTAAIEAHFRNTTIKLAIFASPDNPTGAILPARILQDWCDAYPNTLFVLDEAYADYAPEATRSLLQTSANLIITRTFSKAWGMAGLRLGVMVGPVELIGVLKRVRSPYSVNSLALQIASRLLTNLTQIRLQSQAVMQRKVQVMEALQRRGYRLIPGHANFFLMAVGLDAEGFCHFFQQQGILLRNQSGRPMLQGMVRVSIGTNKEMEGFLAVLDAARQKRVLLFDMDGTLVDTRRSFDATVAQLVEKHSGYPLEAGALDALRAEGDFNDDWEATVELLRRRNIQAYYNAIAAEAQILYLGLAPKTETLLAEPDRLAALKQRYRLGVATGRCRLEFDPVWKERFASLFDVVVCQDDSPMCAKKPSPELLHTAIAAMNAESGLYIGNSVDDMRAAKAAGLVAVGIALTHTPDTLREAGADHVFVSLDELIGALLP